MRVGVPVRVGLKGPTAAGEPKNASSGHSPVHDRGGRGRGEMALPALDGGAR